ncbi:hypothetical protein ACP70R_038312 [Stipagrostis hirtigluma subsp. patula]
MTDRKHERRRWSGDHREAWGSSSSRHAQDDGAGESASSSPEGAPAAEEEEKVAAAAAACRFEFGDNRVSDALLAALAELGASAPRFVDRKQLTSTDVRVNQNRLQISRRSPIDQVFVTGAEKAGLRTHGGLPVAAFDRAGRPYALSCKFFRGKSYYRLRGTGWGSFLTNHGLGIPRDAKIKRRVMLELWAFRSRALMAGGGDDGDGGREPGHPDGALGLVVLHRDEGKLEELEPEPEEEAEVEYVEDAEAPPGTCAEHGEGAAGPEATVAAHVRQGDAPEAVPRAEGYDELKVQQLAAAVLFSLMTSDRTRTKRKRGNDDHRRKP